MADKVNHPQHYLSNNGMEVIDIIENFNLGFCCGNAIKYILRAGHKQDFQGQDQKEKTIEDFQKAIFYLNRRIKELEDNLCD